MRGSTKRTSAFEENDLCTVWFVQVLLIRNKQSLANI